MGDHDWAVTSIAHPLRNPAAYVDEGIGDDDACGDSPLLHHQCIDQAAGTACTAIAQPGNDEIGIVRDAIGKFIVQRRARRWFRVEFHLAHREVLAQRFSHVCQQFERAWLAIVDQSYAEPLVKEAALGNLSRGQVTVRQNGAINLNHGHL